MITPLGRFICRVRTARRLSQKQLALQLGVDPSYLSRVESGLKTPANISFLDSVIDVLSLSPDEAAELYCVSQASQNSFPIPRASTERVRLLMRELMSSVPKLNESQLTFLEVTVAAINAGVIGTSK